MAQHPAHSQNHRHPDEPPPEEIALALKGADYPMGKEKLMALEKQWRGRRSHRRARKDDQSSFRQRGRGDARGNTYGLISHEF
jgi:hypothetical protein